MTAQVLNPEDIEAARLRVSCSSSLWQGLAAQLLGAFPDAPDIVDKIAERHGAEIHKALDFVAARVVHEVRREGLVARKIPLRADGCLRRRIGWGE